MANLNDTIVNGTLSVTDSIYINGTKVGTGGSAIDFQTLADILGVTTAQLTALVNMCKALNTSTTTTSVEFKSGVTVTSDAFNTI